MSLKYFNLFPQLKNVIVQSTRGHKFTIVKSWTGGVKYPGFTYFPRPGQVDPPYEATKLFMVRRLKKFPGIPKAHKLILTSIGLGEDKKTLSAVAIVKNTTDINARLWKIKHLIEIKPITTPNGLPKDGDLSKCYLNDNGEFVVSEELKPDQARIEAFNKFMSCPKKIEQDIYKKACRLKWMNAFWSAL